MRPQHGDILVADLDNDNDLDLLIAGEQRANPFAYQGGLFKNDGIGNFSRTQTNITPGYMAAMDVGDIDGNGSLDVIFNGGVNMEAKWSKGIALNDGSGNFTLAPESLYPLPPSKCTSSLFADFNNDGLLDYLHAGNSSDSCTAIFLQQSNGEFLEDKSSFAKYQLTDPLFQAVDYNNDGYVDLFLMAWLEQSVDNLFRGRITGLFENDGTGKFILRQLPFVRMKSFGSADWDDVDGNGWLDFIIHGEGSTSFESNDWLTRIYNNEKGAFSEAFKYERSRQFSIGGATILQDINNDGAPDVLFEGWSDRLIPNPRQKTFVYMNNDKNNLLEYEDLNENYFLSNQYLPGMSEQDFEIADVDGNNKPDFIYMGFAEGYADNPYNPNRVIAAWSPSPVDQGLYMEDYKNSVSR
ncbi:MAG: FG-GAP repeat domain-containing protein, partial [Paludibacteraceae bacterium]